MPRVPQHDSLPPSPVDYEDIPFGAGQEPRVYGMFQWSRDYGVLSPKQIRRDPDHASLVVVGRWPERPV